MQRVKSLWKILSEKIMILIYPILLRPSTVHGPSPRMRFDLIVNHFVKDAVLNRKLEIFGADLWRPLMWLRSWRIVERIIKSENKIIKNQIFNLGNTNANKKKRILLK